MLKKEGEYRHYKYHLIDYPIFSSFRTYLTMNESKNESKNQSIS